MMSRTTQIIPFRHVFVLVALENYRQRYVCHLHLLKMMVKPFWSLLIENAVAVTELQIVSLVKLCDYLELFLLPCFYFYSSLMHIEILNPSHSLLFFDQFQLVSISERVCHIYNSRFLFYHSESDLKRSIC